MGNFNRTNKKSSGGFSRGFSGGKKFGGGGRNSFGDRDGGRPTMHKATCSDCGDSCELPFRPTGDRPVFCNNCFGKQDGGGRPNKFSGERRGRSERRERPRFEDKQMHSAVCAKCGEDCQVPFRPTGDKPVFCSGCFGKNDTGSAGGRSNGSKGCEDTAKQIKRLEDKLDKIIEMLGHDTSVEKIEKSKVEQPKVEKKEKTKTKVATKKASKKTPTKKKK